MQDEAKRTEAKSPSDRRAKLASLVRRICRGAAREARRELAAREGRVDLGLI